MMSSHAHSLPFNFVLVLREICMPHVRYQRVRSPSIVLAFITTRTGKIIIGCISSSLIHPVIEDAARLPATPLGNLYALYALYIDERFRIQVEASGKVGWHNVSRKYLQANSKSCKFHARFRLHLSAKMSVPERKQVVV